MGRRLKIDRPVAVKVYVPTSIWNKVEDLLYSEVEGRIPHGRQSELVSNLLTNWLREKGVLV